MDNPGTLRIGILKTGTAPPTVLKRFGDYDELFTKLLGSVAGNLESKTYDCQAGEFPDPADGGEGYIITGSRCSALDGLGWIHDLSAWIRDADAARTKVFGVCFGHQIIAQALGGVVEKNPRGWEVAYSRFPVIDDAKHMIAPLADLHHIEILQMHQDHVAVPPPGLVCFAANAHTPVQGLIHPHRHIMSFQGHPEFTCEIVEEMLHARRGDVIPDHVALAGLASLANPLDPAPLASLMHHFFTLPTLPS